MYWFCHISKWIRHRYTCVLHPEPSSILPPYTIPLGHPSAPAPSIQYRASNLDSRLISYMLLYMFQCHSPKSSHPLPLPQSLIDCSEFITFSLVGIIEKLRIKKAVYYHVYSWLVYTPGIVRPKMIWVTI